MEKEGENLEITIVWYLGNITNRLKQLSWTDEMLSSKADEEPDNCAEGCHHLNPQPASPSPKVGSPDNMCPRSSTKWITQEAVLPTLTKKSWNRIQSS